MANPSPSYRATLAVPGFGRIIGASLIGRGANQMLSVVIVLFVLARFHSPALAGIAVFATIGPSLVVSPVAGALLDRYGRVRLMMLDYWLAAASLAVMAALSVGGLLSPPVLVLVALVGGITGILSAAGMRSVVPLLLPPDLWGRGNAIDSSGYTITVIIGPALGGFSVGVLGPEAAILIAAALYAAGAISLLGAPEPGPKSRATESLLRSALAGVQYVARHAVLRAIAASLVLLNIGAGVMVVAMPVLALQHLHGSSAVVGILWALQGVGGASAGFIFGRLDTNGHERWIIVAAVVVTAIGTALMAVAPNLYALGVGSLVVGLATGPLDVTLFSLRQRVTGTQWLGRAIAVSMTFNFIGFPIGSALSGAFIAVGVRFALGLAAVLALCGGAVGALALPQPARSGAGHQDHRQQDQRPAH
ncbi:MAG: MFS transporter [Candidatus Dormibacteraeota bacterium]|nr:MFS transporter [Candidatus Dormibacteraeota bacterium]